jgi:aryl-alcohol dehydrogenase-like predicted oxidoreductase
LSMSEPNGRAPGRSSSQAADRRSRQTAHALGAFVLGTAQLTTRYGFMAPAAPRPTDHADEVLATARALGVQTLDTAPAYGDAEAAIGQAGWRGAVHTKVLRGLAPADSLQASLRRLQRDRVALLYLHDASEVLVTGSEVIAHMGALVGRGADLIGVSVYEVEEFEAAVATPEIGAIQVPLNLFDRRFVPLLAAGIAAGKKVYVRSVFLQGALLAHPAKLPGHLAALRPYVQRLRDAAETMGRTPAELALAWIQSIPGVAGIIVGVQSPTELRELAVAAGAHLDGSALAALDAFEAPPRSLSDPRLWGRAP